MSNPQIQQACNIEINYSEIIVEGRILPFVIALDIANSNLTPAPGQNQRFCYTVTGVGEDTNTFVDLSHFVLEICNQIPANQIQNISVVIDGVEQDVVFGENVELRPPNNPDPPTGCPGLKFDFGLDKVEGDMSVCFELTQTYPVGSNNVCLFGGNLTAEGLNICGPVCSGDVVGNCETVAYQPVSVCVPVTVTPYANTLPATTFCCGDPVITPGPTTCSGVENGSCSFTISQNICVSVPIEFGARTDVGNTFVECGEATDEDVCTDCNSEANQEQLFDSTSIRKNRKKKSTKPSRNDSFFFLK